MAAKRSPVVCFPSLPPSITRSPRPCLSRQLQRLCLVKGQEVEEQKAFLDAQGTSRSAAAWGRFPLLPGSPGGQAGAREGAGSWGMLRGAALPTRAQSLVPANPSQENHC